MKKTYLLCAFCLFTSMLLLNGCDKKVAKLANQPVAAASAPAGCDTVTYNEDIKTIVDQKCGSGAGCHAGPFPSGNVSLTNYAEVKAKADANRIKVRVFDQGDMPQSPVTLTQAERDLLFCWINNGAKQ